MPAGSAAGLVVVLVTVAITVAVPAVAGTPPSYRTDQVQPVAPGIEYRRLVRDEGPVVAHVVAVRPHPSHQLAALLSNDQVGGPPPQTERTSEMCRRASCLVAVNGDYFLPSGQPVGGVAQGGRLVRSPVAGHNQVSVTGTGAVVAGVAGWSGELTPIGLEPLRFDAVNRERGGDGVVLFTPDYGPSTGTDESGAELVVRVLGLHPPGTLGPTALVELLGLADGGGDTPIPRDGAVVSAAGEGAVRLRALWATATTRLLGTRGTLRLETTPPAAASVGGNPLLLEAGRITWVDDGSEFGSARHPRTLVGWNGTETFFVAVDGRQDGYSVGLTLAEAADLLAGLGATDGINLDGGGSTTMVVGGRVVNRPSDRLVRTRAGTERVVAYPRPSDTVLGLVERPVVDALAVVPRPPAPLPLLGDLLGPLLQRPGPGVAWVAPHSDPASRSTP